ncbi:hypothetical protein [Nonomuraea composti]|uniref:hypothetical protein n=1 Tax=Nonomuraea composti TaxID=2720023 RepID=UPI001980611D|nr:hypothetical protein [Nonomuraea sp. FMUSA5-5]
MVVKGPELGAGYAQAEPGDHGWTARTAPFPDAVSIPLPVAGLADRLNALRDRLNQPISPVAVPFRGTALDRHRVLTLIARHLRNTGAVLLNETSLRSVPLGAALRVGDLLAIEPFGNHLVRAHLADAADDAFLDTLTSLVGPLIVHRGRDRMRCAWTTRYLADTFLGGRWNGPPLPLAQAVQEVLTGRTGDAA